MDCSDSAVASGSLSQARGADGTTGALVAGPVTTGALTTGALAAGWGIACVDGAGALTVIGRGGDGTVLAVSGTPETGFSPPRALSSPGAGEENDLAGARARPAAWVAVARVLINLDEFITRE